MTSLEDDLRAALRAQAQALSVPEDPRSNATWSNCAAFRHRVG